MPSELIKSLNWVDILIILAFIRIIYIGGRQGFLVEVAKNLGLVFGIIIAMHYYITLADFVIAHSPLPTGFADLLCFSALLLAVVMVFKFIREGLAAIIKAEPIPFVHSWGGFILGVLRAWIFSSVIIYVLLISGFGYLEKAARQAYSTGYIINVAPQIYSVSFDKVVNRFFPGEKINNTVFDVVSSEPKKTK